MKHQWLSILFVSGVIYNTVALSIDCGEFYDDDTISKNWGYVYYSCNGTVLDYVNGSGTMELFGFHIYGRNSSHTERFALNNQNLTSFPTDFEKFFPFLRIINFSFNYIDSVTHNQLQPHKRLNSLVLDHNKISTLDSNLFDGLDQLIMVSLNNNDIKHVGYDIKLPTYVYMDNNPCTPSCCTFFTYTTSTLISEYVRNSCPPLQSTLLKSVGITSEIGTSNIVDHTQEKDEAPATEEPSIDTKLPNRGELIDCSFKVLLRENNEPLGKRCSEMYNSDDASYSIVKVFGSPEFKNKTKQDIDLEMKAKAMNAQNSTVQ